MSVSVAHLVSIGVLGLDPAGVVVALAAVSLGVRRRGLTVLVSSFGVAIVVLGTAATWLAGLLSHTAAVRWVTDTWHAHHLLCVAELLLGAALLIAAGVLVLRTGRPPSPASDEASSDESVPDGTMRAAGRLDGPRALTVAGVAVAASLMLDPAFAVLAVSLTGTPSWALPPAWLLWAGISQLPMLLLWAVAGLSRRGVLLDRVSGWIRRALTHSGLVLRIGLVVLGLVLVRAGLHRIGLSATGWV